MPSTGREDDRRAGEQPARCRRRRGERAVLPAPSTPPAAAGRPRRGRAARAGARRSGRVARSPNAASAAVASAARSPVQQKYSQSLPQKTLAARSSAAGRCSPSQAKLRALRAGRDVVAGGQRDPARATPLARQRSTTGAPAGRAAGSPARPHRRPRRPASSRRPARSARALRCAARGPAAAGRAGAAARRPAASSRPAPARRARLRGASTGWGSAARASSRPSAAKATATSCVGPASNPSRMSVGRAIALVAACWAAV